MRAIISIILSLSLIGCSSASELTLEQKAAKLIIVGVIGTSLDEGNPIIEDIEQKGISGVILFENNISPEGDSRAQMAQFISDLQSRATTPLFISIDQEGGRVNRMKSKYGFSEMPSQLSVCEAGDDEYTHRIAELIASEVASVGINMNFTPCVDLNINPTSPAIGGVERSFSEAEAEVTSMASIYIGEHHRHGLLTAMKHFPGHGSATVDSHLGLTDITDTWQERELAPYRELISRGDCDMVMVSHLFHQDIDPSYPASLSKIWIDEILRGDLGWDGVVVSDDMQMRAITDEYGFEEAVTRGLNAGVDLFIFSRYSNSSDVTSRFIETITDGVKNGTIDQGRVNEAVNRVEKLRKRVIEQK